MRYINANNSFVQYYLLDVIALFIVIVVITTHIVRRILRFEGNTKVINSLLKPVHIKQKMYQGSQRFPLIQQQKTTTSKRHSSQNNTKIIIEELKMASLHVVEFQCGHTASSMENHSYVSASFLFSFICLLSLFQCNLGLFFIVFLCLLFFSKIGLISPERTKIASKFHKYLCHRYFMARNLQRAVV